MPDAFYVPDGELLASTELTRGPWDPGSQHAGPPAALLGGCAMGAAFSLLNPSLMLIALGRVTENARGAAMGTYTAFFDAGVGIGAPLAGLAAALTDYEGAFLFAAAVAVGSALLSLLRLRPSVR